MARSMPAPGIIPAVEASLAVAPSLAICSCINSRDKLRLRYGSPPEGSVLTPASPTQTDSPDQV